MLTNRHAVYCILYTVCSCLTSFLFLQVGDSGPRPGGGRPAVPRWCAVCNGGCRAMVSGGFQASNLNLGHACSTKVGCHMQWGMQVGAVQISSWTGGFECSTYMVRCMQWETEGCGEWPSPDSKSRTAVMPHATGHRALWCGGMVFTFKSLIDGVLRVRWHRR